MLNVTLGTAGHVDHGKTALVKALTGCNTDRLKEEKERGMSIDLGYAPCRVSDLEVGIVDVPGHESFIKTMVAGACGMDGVILVVAADDGIMPQTREHLDILTLLGLRHGLVALTKIDRVDDSRRQQVLADLRGFLQGTFLEGAPILPFSNVTCEGFDPFLAALEGLVRSITPRRADGVFRMPLDRAFSAKGFGTVVAGIPVAGSASLGGEAVLLPQNFTGRIKRIEVYGQAGDTVLCGQCAAINLGHCDAKEIRRGDVLTLPGYFTPQEFYVCRLRLLPLEKISLKSGAEVKFHTGTSEVNATLYPLESGELRGNSTQIVQLRMKRPIVAGPGDPFILRSFSPVRTIGGGTIIEAVERRLKRNRPGIAEDLAVQAAAVGDDARFVEYAIRTAPAIAIPKADLARRTKTLYPRLEEILSRPRARAEGAGPGDGALSSWRHGRRGRRPAPGPTCRVSPPCSGKPGHDLGAAWRGVPLAKAGVGRSCATVEKRRPAGGTQSASGAGRTSADLSRSRRRPSGSDRVLFPASRSSLRPARPSWPRRPESRRPRSTNSLASSKSISGWWRWATGCCFIGKPSSTPGGCWSNTWRRRGGWRA